MKAKDKAIELHDKYYQEFEKMGFDELPNEYAKKHALICANEQIELIKYLNQYNDFSKILSFWKYVKSEITNLTINS